MQAAPPQPSEFVCITFVDTIYRTLRWLVTRGICLLRHLPVELKSQRQNVRHVENLKDWTLPWPLKEGAQVYFCPPWEDGEFSTHLRFPSMKLCLTASFYCPTEAWSQTTSPRFSPFTFLLLLFLRTCPQHSLRWLRLPVWLLSLTPYRKLSLSLTHNERIIEAECPPRLWMDGVLLFPKLPKKSYCHTESKGSIFFNQLHKVDFTSIGF